MTTITSTHIAAFRVRRHPLPDGHHALAVRVPGQLLDPRHAELREAIVAVSDQAFGTSTAHLWDTKFTRDFLEPLARFYLIVDPAQQLVGWSSYRARTIAGERVVYFTSTGLLPKAQRHGLIPALQRRAISREARRHPFHTITTVIRSRNPHSYQLAQRTFGNQPVVPDLNGHVPAPRRALLTAIAAWLEFDDIDSDSSHLRHAYNTETGLYGNEPRSGDHSIDQLFAHLSPQDALLILGRRSRANSLRLAVSSRQRGHRPRTTRLNNADQQRQTSTTTRHH